MARKRIGELLLERGVITRAQLEEGLAYHQQTRQRLGVALLHKGFLTEAQLVSALSEALHIPAIDLAKIQPEWAAIHMLRARFCETHDLFPSSMESIRGRKNLVVAMSDPLNVPAIEEIEFTTGLKVAPRLAPLSAVRTAIARYYHKQSAAQLADSTITAVNSGALTLTVADEVLGDPGEEEVIVGEVLDEPLVKSVSEDLDYLFGVRDEPEPVEQLERKFWALLRLMSRKGLISNEEFAEELEKDPE